MLIGIIPENVSNTHKKLAQLLEKLKPNHKIYLEYPVKRILYEYWEKYGVHYWERDPKLLVDVRYLHYDFYDVTVNLIFEVQGEHHNSFNIFFHRTLGDLDTQKYNDHNKRVVAKITNIPLIELATDTDITEKWVNNKYKEIYV